MPQNIFPPIFIPSKSLLDLSFSHYNEKMRYFISPKIKFKLNLNACPSASDVNNKQTNMFVHI